jgi:hypothetical protein
MSAQAPYVVRFGPWARNLYLGLPAVFAFALIGVIARLPLPVLVAWNALLAVVLWICAFPREVRFFRDGSVVCRRCFLALLPVWWRSYPPGAFRSIRQYDASFQFVGEPSIEAATIFLVHKSGRLLPVQSYSAGADNQPSPMQLGQELSRRLGLPFER